MRLAQEHSPPVAQLAVKLIIAKNSDTLIDFICLPRLLGFDLEVIALGIGPTGLPGIPESQPDEKDGDDNSAAYQRIRDHRQPSVFAGTEGGTDRFTPTFASFFAVPKFMPRKLIAFRR